MSASLALARPPVGPNQQGFPVHPLGDSTRERSPFELYTPWSAYGTVERDKQTNDMFRTTMGGLVRLIVEEFALANVGALISACTVHPINNPNSMRIVVKRRIMKPGVYKQTASFGVPHILTSRETQQEVTAQRYIIGAYAESIYTETPEGAARLVAAMRQIGFAWTRTIQVELQRVLFEESYPIGSRSVDQFVRTTDPARRSALLAEHCLNRMRLYALPRKRPDGHILLRKILTEEARQRNKAAPDTIFVAEMAQLEMPVTPNLFKGSETTDAFANAAMAHQVPKGSYAHVADILEGNARTPAFVDAYPVGLFHPGFDPLKAYDELNPNELTASMHNIVFADHQTKRWATVTTRHVLDSVGFFGAGGGLSAAGLAFFRTPPPIVNPTLNDFLEQFGMDIPPQNAQNTGFAGGVNLFGTPLANLTKDDFLRHLNTGGLLPFGYVVLRNVQTRAGAAIATCGKPVDALIGTAQMDATKTALLEMLATSVGFMGARVTDVDGVIHAPGVVTQELTAGGSFSKAEIVDLADPNQIRAFLDGRSEKRILILPVWPGEVEALIQKQVVYPDLHDPANPGAYQVPSYAVLRQALGGQSIVSSRLRLDQVLAGGIGARVPAFYARSHTLGATMGVTGQPEFRVPRCVDAIFGSGTEIHPDSFANLFEQFA